MFFTPAGQKLAFKLRHRRADGASKRMRPPPPGAGGTRWTVGYAQIEFEIGLCEKLRLGELIASHSRIVLPFDKGITLYFLRATRPG